MNRDAFSGALREALGHLHEPEALSRSPLIDWMGLRGNAHPGQALRLTLEQTIEAFRPSGTARPDDISIRRYRILKGRYIQRLTQQVLAHGMAISPRHLRRLQAEVLQAIEEYLWLRYDLPSSPRTSPSETDDVEVNREMLWLIDSMGDRSSDVQEVLGEVIDLAQSLLDKPEVLLSSNRHQAIPLAAMPRTVLKQIVLNLMTAIHEHVTPGIPIRLHAEMQGEWIVILLSASVCKDYEQLWLCSGKASEAIPMARRLLELFDGELALAVVDGLLVAKVLVPHEAPHITVLAIEDNIDTLHIWERYLKGTRYRLMGETHPEKALARATAVKPDLVVLDVMLPSIDGWKLLPELRKHPATADVPIIVCTVMPQEDLALALGATDFIQKPVTGKVFRATLERQIELAKRASKH